MMTTKRGTLIISLWLGLGAATGCGDLQSGKGLATAAGNNQGSPGTGGTVGGDGAGQIPTQPVDDGIIPQPHRTDWITTQGNHFYRQGNVWIGRGVTMHDTRSCDWCTSHAPNVPELKRRVDEAVDTWHVNLIRLLLQSFSTADYGTPGSGQRVQWQSFMNDPQYLHDIQEIVEYIGTKPGVYVLVSLWKDPSFTPGATATQEGGWPTPATAQEWTRLAEVFQNEAHVMYGVVNEPEHDDPTKDAACVASMSSVVQAIRAVEDGAKAPHHIVTVQGTRQWGRILDYYVTHPIMDDNGDNVAYETHAYTAQSNFPTSLEAPAKTLPVIVGEFAPASDYMSLSDAEALMDDCDAHQIPYAAWDFHTNCNSGQGNNMLLQDTGKCVYGIPLTPTQWGQAVKDHITSKQ